MPKTRSMSSLRIPGAMVLTKVVRIKSLVNSIELSTTKVSITQNRRALATTRV